MWSSANVYIQWCTSPISSAALVFAELWAREKERQQQQTEKWRENVFGRESQQLVVGERKTLLKATPTLTYEPISTWTFCARQVATLARFLKVHWFVSRKPISRFWIIRLYQAVLGKKSCQLRLALGPAHNLSFRVPSCKRNENGQGRRSHNTTVALGNR